MVAESQCFTFTLIVMFFMFTFIVSNCVCVCDGCLLMFALQSVFASCRRPSDSIRVAFDVHSVVGDKCWLILDLIVTSFGLNANLIATCDQCGLERILDCKFGTNLVFTGT